MKREVHVGRTAFENLYADNVPAQSYAYRLARYITDASTIYAHTKSVYGHAPFLSDIKMFMEQQQTGRRRKLIETPLPEAVVKTPKHACRECGMPISPVSSTGLCKSHYLADLAAKKAKKAKAKDHHKVPLDALMKSACRVFKIPMRLLIGVGRQRVETDARRVVIYLAVGERHTRKDICAALHRDVDTVRNALEAAQAAYGTDDIFTARVKSVWASVADLA